MNLHSRASLFVSLFLRFKWDIIDNNASLPAVRFTLIRRD